jgi:hypothetical protein
MSPIKLKLGQISISVKGVISLKRLVKGKSVFVVRFRSETGEDELLNSVINKVIYQHYQKSTLEFLRQRLKEIKPS